MKKFSIYVEGEEVKIRPDLEDPDCLTAAVDKWLQKKTLEQVFQLGDSYITDETGKEITVGVLYSVIVASKPSSIGQAIKKLVESEQ